MNSKIDKTNETENVNVTETILSTKLDNVTLSRSCETRESGAWLETTLSAGRRGTLKVKENEYTFEPDENGTYIVRDIENGNGKRGIFECKNKGVETRVGRYVPIRQTIEVDFTGTTVQDVLERLALPAIAIRKQNGEFRKNGSTWMKEHPIVKLKAIDLLEAKQTKATPTVTSVAKSVSKMSDAQKSELLAILLGQAKS